MDSIWGLWISEGRGLSLCRGLTDITESHLNQGASHLTTSWNVFTLGFWSGKLHLLLPIWVWKQLKGRSRSQADGDQNVCFTTDKTSEIRLLQLWRKRASLHFPQNLAKYSMLARTAKQLHILRDLALSRWICALAATEEGEASVPTFSSQAEQIRRESMRNKNRAPSLQFISEKLFQRGIVEPAEYCLSQQIVPWLWETM